MELTIRLVCFLILFSWFLQFRGKCFCQTRKPQLKRVLQALHNWNLNQLGHLDFVQVVLGWFFEAESESFAGCVHRSTPKDKHVHKRKSKYTCGNLRSLYFILLFFVVQVDFLLKTLICLQAASLFVTTRHLPSLRVIKRHKTSKAII